MVEPISTIIISALIAGAAAAAKDTASQTIKDAYQGLKTLIQNRFKGNKSAEVALDEASKDPETWEKPLAKAIEEYHLDQEKEIVELAQKLQELLEKESSRASKYNVNIGSSGTTVIGDHTQIDQRKGNSTISD